MTGLLTLAEAAQTLAISVRRMRQLVAAGRVRHERAGRTILIRPRDLDAVRERRPGRPRSSHAA
jgi:excisionase family DNA binding protein